MVCVAFFHGVRAWRARASLAARAHGTPARRRTFGPREGGTGRYRSKQGSSVRWLSISGLAALVALDFGRASL